MKSEVFIDTSGWLCFFDTNQTQHRFVRSSIEHHIRQGGHFVTTSGVFDELIPLLSTRTRASRRHILDCVVKAQNLPRLEVIHITAKVHHAAFELLQARLDKEWSWVDAASFIVMQSRGLTQALTTDHHFEQAGLCNCWLSSLAQKTEFWLSAAFSG